MSQRILPGFRGARAKQYAPKTIHWPDIDSYEVIIPGLKLHSLNWMLAGISEGSRRMRHAAAKHQRQIVAMVLRSELGPARNQHLRVIITRMSPGTLDDDSLPASAKHVRDGIADWLGIDDRNPRVEWRYEQRATAPRSCGVSINIQWLRTPAPSTLPGVA